MPLADPAGRSSAHRRWVRCHHPTFRQAQSQWLNRLAPEANKQLKPAARRASAVATLLARRAEDWRPAWAMADRARHPSPRRSLRDCTARAPARDLVIDPAQAQAHSPAALELAAAWQSRSAEVARSAMCGPKALARRSQALAQAAAQVDCRPRPMARAAACRPTFRHSPDRARSAEPARVPVA